VLVRAVCSLDDSRGGYFVQASPAYGVPPYVAATQQPGFPAQWPVLSAAKVDEGSGKGPGLDCGWTSNQQATQPVAQVREVGKPSCPTASLASAQTAPCGKDGQPFRQPSKTGLSSQLNSSWASQSVFHGAGSGTRAAGREAAEEDEYLMRLLRGNCAQPAPSVTATGSGAGFEGSNGSNPGNGSGQEPSTDKKDSSHAEETAGGSSAGAVPDQVSWPTPKQMIEKLGERTFSSLRNLIVQQQGTFLGQIWELHRVAKQQEHLVQTCEQPDALKEAMQGNQQQPGLAVPPVLQQQPGPCYLQAPGVMPSPLSGFYVPHMMFPPPPFMPYGMPQAAVDPISAWYAQHYRGQAMPLQAVGSRPAGEAAKEEGPVRWWQDPRAVFGPSAVAEAVAAAAAGSGDVMQPAPSQRCGIGSLGHCILQCCSLYRKGRSFFIILTLWLRQHCENCV
jgi:hypothetical protein